MKSNLLAAVNWKPAKTNNLVDKTYVNMQIEHVNVDKTESIDWIQGQLKLRRADRLVSLRAGNKC